MRALGREVAEQLEAAIINYIRNDTHWLLVKNSDEHVFDYNDTSYTRITVLRVTYDPSVCDITVGVHTGFKDFANESISISRVARRTYSLSELTFGSTKSNQGENHAGKLAKLYDLMFDSTAYLEHYKFDFNRPPHPADEHYG